MIILGNKAADNYRQTKPKYTAKKENKKSNADLMDMTPTSDEVRLHDESENDSVLQKENGGIKRIKLKDNPYFDHQRNSVTKRVHIEAREYNQPEILRPANEVTFSSWEFHSIDEFSLEQSNIVVRKMDFGSKDEQSNCEYGPTWINKKRININIRNRGKESQNTENTVRERGRGVFIREVSSFEKSVEMPSSYLEPSVFFDERDGQENFENANRITNYNFNSWFSKGSRPSIIITKLPQWMQINPKEADLDSPHTMSMSEELSIKSSDTSRRRNERNKLQKQPSEYFEFSASQSHEEVKQKPKLNDFITQVDPGQGLLKTNNTENQYKFYKNNKNKVSNERKHISGSKGHGSTGGAESSPDLSDLSHQNDNSKIDWFEKLNAELAK